MSSYTPISTRGGHWSRYLRQVCSKKTPAHPHGIVCGGRRGRNPAHPGTVRECLGRIENCVHMAETTRSLLGACPTQWMTEQKEERNVMIDSTSHECLRVDRKLGASIARALAFAVASQAAITGGTANAAATLDHASYGTTQGGQAVDIFTMTNDHGLRVRFLSLGGVITEIDVPDHAGRLDNIVLGLKTLKEYETLPGHFGAITGRYANRIGGAQFTLGGQTYHLIANNGANTLHGGPNALDKQVWAVAPATVQDGVSATLSYVSKDGDQNFPGTLTTKVVYTLTNDNALKIDYIATTDKDTVVNFTNHSYFNL